MAPLGLDVFIQKPTRGEPVPSGCDAPSTKVFVVNARALWQAAGPGTKVAPRGSVTLPNAASYVVVPEPSSKCHAFVAAPASRKATGRHFPFPSRLLS